MGYWRMGDGQRWRMDQDCALFQQGYTTDKRTFEYLHEHLWLQAVSKSGEVSFDLRLTNITESKEYLNGTSIEQVIHEVESKHKTNIP